MSSKVESVEISLKNHLYPCPTIYVDKTYGQSGPKSFLCHVFDRQSAHFDLVQKVGIWYSTHNLFITATTYHILTLQNKYGKQKISPQDLVS